MTILITILNAITGSLTLLEALIAAALKMWNDYHAAGVINPDQLANDATGAAEAAIDLEQDVHKQIALVTSILLTHQPAITIEHATAVAAAAVAVAKDRRIKG